MFMTSINNKRHSSVSNSAKKLRSMSPNQGSLNFVTRKNELKKQIDENFRMLKKIHYARPTVKNKDLLKHEERTN